MDWIEFVQDLSGKTGYAYIYRKRIGLSQRSPEMVISYSLRNSGSKVIHTTQFNHNFFIMDSQPSGPDFEARFPFKIHPLGGSRLPG